MKAVVTTKYGPAEVLEIEEVPDPVLKNDEILVRVHACSVNPVDWKIRNGEARLLTGRRPPRVLGGDYAGTVAAVGSKVAEFKPGDAVWGMVNAFKGGTYAEYVAVKQAEIGLKPEQLGFEEAASIPLVGLTAYQSLVHLGRAGKGDSVLINGCSGGVGTAGVQIAKALGCRVEGTCSSRNQDLARRLGADEVIDYTRENVLEHAARYDLFFDAVAGCTFTQAKTILNPGGTYISTVPSLRTMLAAPLLTLLGSRNYKLIFAKPCAKDLEALKEMADRGALVSVVEEVFPLEQVREAHARSESGRVAGKLVLKLS